MAAIVYDRTMSATEALMWRLERDPRLSSAFANVMVLDRPPDVDRLRRRLERTASVVPRLRQVVRPPAGFLAAPVWVDAADFDVDDHLRRIALPPPGDDRQLLDLAALVAADPFDRTRPLWQFVLVEGLRGGRAALIEKLHHTIGDGEAGVQLALEFLDVERDAPEPPPPPADPVDDGDDDGETVDEDASVEAVRDLLAGVVRLPVGVAHQVRRLLADPARLPDASEAAAATLHDLAGQLADTEPARSPLWTRRSSRRRLAVATAPLEETRAVATKLGGTLNTAFLTLAAAAAGGYHRACGTPVEALRASVAISTRRDGAGANAFSLVRVLVPTGDAPLAERFRSIEETTRTAIERDGDASLGRIAAYASTLPTSVITRLARRHARSIDFATSNVRGSPETMFVAGAELVGNIPVGPLGGVAFNATLLSYRDRLDIGLHIDAGAVEHPAELKRQFDEVIAQFTAL